MPDERQFHIRLFTYRFTICHNFLFQCCTKMSNCFLHGKLAVKLTKKVIIFVVFFSFKVLFLFWFHMETNDYSSFLSQILVYYFQKRIDLKLWLIDFVNTTKRKIFLWHLSVRTIQHFYSFKVSQVFHAKKNSSHVTYCLDINNNCLIFCTHCAILQEATTNFSSGTTLSWGGRPFRLLLLQKNNIPEKKISQMNRILFNH